MKKLISILLAVFLISTFAVNATAAEEKFEKMKDLNNYWALNDAYPDWFCGVWTETGSLNNLVVAVLNTEEGNLGKQEILDLIEVDSSVTFTYGDYSRNYLIDVKESFTYETFQELGLSYTAFLDDKSRIELGILKDKKNDPVALKKLEEIKAQYGEIFVVKYVDGITTEDILKVEDMPAVHYTVVPESKSNRSYFIYIYIAIAVALFLSVACLLIQMIQRKSLVLKTNTGHNFSTSGMSVKEIEERVKTAEAEVPSDLEDRIFKEIESKM